MLSRVYAPWTEENKSAALQHCSIGHHQAHAMISILEAAYAADGAHYTGRHRSRIRSMLQQANALIADELKS